MSLTILCYGDSLTYGARPDARARHRRDDRWPAVLADGLGPEAEVVAEGLNGRTTAWDSYDGATDRNGARLLPAILQSHAPLDLAIFLLGTNDILVLEASPRQAARGVARLVEIVRHHPYYGEAAAPKVLIVAPPPPRRAETGAIKAEDILRAAGLAEAYRAVAEETGAAFFDAASVIECSPVDGVHLDAHQSRALGEALVPIVQDLLAG